MEYTSLGKNGLKVSVACMGTMTFGKQTDEQTAKAMVSACMDAGINFFDTADFYNGGRSEEILGRALKGIRDEVIISSKVFYPMGGGPNDRGLSRRRILSAVEASLRRLGSDFLDIYLLHAPDNTTPMEETLSAMDALVRSGKVRYIGCSNYAAWQLVQALWIADRRNLIPLSVTQPMYNLLARRIEQELLPACEEFGIGVTVYNPLAGGMLSGKYDTPDSIPEGTRFNLYDFYQDRYWNQVNFEAVAALKKIAAQAGKSLVEFSLRWCLNHPAVQVVVIGASRPEQLEQNLSAFRASRRETAFTSDQLAACHDVWLRLRGVAPDYNR